MRWFLVIVTWWFAATVTLGVAAEFREGPVLFTLSATHGVHLGDALFAWFAYWWARRVSRVLLATPSAS
jgi:hypothetical protein